MGNLFQNNQAAPQLSPHQKLEAKYNAGRANMLIALAFTLVNIVVLLANGGYYFLFSIFVPYFLADLGMLLCGNYPAEYYLEHLPNLKTFETDTFFFIMLVIAAVILIMYTLCWLFSSKGRVGWMITALVLFSIDSVLLLLIGGINADMLVDALFHIWVLYYLIAGIIAHFKWKALPPEEESAIIDGLPEQPTNEFPIINDLSNDSTNENQE